MTFRWVVCWAEARPVKAVSIVRIMANLSHSLLFMLLISLRDLTPARAFKVVVELLRARENYSTIDPLIKQAIFGFQKLSTSVTPPLRNLVTAFVFSPACVTHPTKR